MTSSKTYKYACQNHHTVKKTNDIGYFILYVRLNVISKFFKVFIVLKLNWQENVENHTHFIPFYTEDPVLYFRNSNVYFLCANTNSPFLIPEFVDLCRFCLTVKTLI